MATHTATPTTTITMTDTPHKPTFRIRPARPEDSSEMIEIVTNAFKGSEVTRIFFHGPDFSADREGQVVRMKMFFVSPSYRVMVAEDLATGKLCGFSSWEATGTTNPLLKDWLAEKRSIWSPLDALNRGLLKLESFYGRYVGWTKYNWSLFMPYLNQRKDLDKEGGVWPQNHLHCHELAILPEYQGKGAGKALLKWGMDLADQYDIATTLESTVAGRPLYERCGFKAVKFLTLAEGYPDKQYELPCMLRLPQKTSAA